MTDSQASTAGLAPLDSGEELSKAANAGALNHWFGGQASGNCTGILQQLLPSGILATVLIILASPNDGDVKMFGG